MSDYNYQINVSALADPGRNQDHNGTLIPESGRIRRSEAFAVAHEQTFQTLWNTSTNLYRSLADEAFRDDPDNARKMWLDADIRAMLQERILPSASLALEVRPDDPKNPEQIKFCEKYTKLIEAIPRLGVLKRYLQRSIYFGRYGAHFVHDWVDVDGVRMAGIVGHRPVNGDKINNSYFGYPAYLVRPTWTHPLARFQYSDRGGKFLLLDSDYWRRKFAIQEDDPVDRDFYTEADMAGMIHGEGLRSILYYPWFLNQALSRWKMEAEQRLGINGSYYGYCEESNPEAEQAVLTALAMLVKDNIAVFPKKKGSEFSGIVNIPPSGVAYEVISQSIELNRDKMRMLLVGQTLSSGTAATGMGSGVAQLHETTKGNLIRADVDRLGETFTDDILKPLIRLNGDRPNFGVKVVFIQERVDRAEFMESAIQANQLIDLDEEDVRDKTGWKKPTDPAHTIKSKISMQGTGGAPGTPGLPAPLTPGETPAKPPELNGKPQGDVPPTATKPPAPGSPPIPGSTPSPPALANGSATASYAAYTPDLDDPGVMIALYPPEDVAKDLKIPGGVHWEEMHITLAYLGKLSEVGKKNLARVERAIKLAVMDQPVLVGSIGGIGRFPASVSSDGMGVIYAGVDVPGLTELRQEIIRDLARWGVDHKKNHGFTPHVTLDYVDPKSPIHLDQIESKEVAFRAVYIVIGNTRIRIPFGMHARRTRDRLGKVRGGVSQVHYESRHAPHNIEIGGKTYRGGEFIPSEVANSPEGRAKLSGNRPSATSGKPGHAKKAASIVRKLLDQGANDDEIGASLADSKIDRDTAREALADFLDDGEIDDDAIDAILSAMESNNHDESPDSDKKYRTFTHGNAADDWGKQAFESWHETLDYDQDMALGDYRMNSYKAINLHLRGIEPNISDADRESIEYLDAALEKAALPEPVVSYRAFRADVCRSVFGIEPHQIDQLVGGLYCDDGFASSTLDERLGLEYQAEAGLLCDIRVPKGYNAAYLPPPDYPDEKELLLKRGSKFRVISADPKNRRAVLEIEP